MYNDNDDYDGLPPSDWDYPTRQQDELESSSDFIAFEFGKISIHPDSLWFILSCAGRSLVGMANKRAPERLSPARRDRLIAGILKARYAVLEASCGTGPDLEPMLSEAFDGAIILANHLAETDEERAARHPHVVLDASDRLMIAVLAARAHLLAEDVRRRADKRITDEVAAIVATALRAAA